jgi:hypothetical protein
MAGERSLGAALAGTAALFLAARGPGRALLSRLPAGSGAGFPGPRLPDPRSQARRVLAEGVCPACLALGFLGPAGEPAVATETRQA